MYVRRRVDLNKIIGAKIVRIESEWKIILEKGGKEYELIANGENSWFDVYEYTMALDFVLGQFSEDEEFLV